MIVTDQHHLDQLIDELSKCHAVAVDTEFFWMKTYDPALALVQFSGGGTTFAMDPLAVKDYSRLKKFLEDPKVVKIFHACEQDLIILEKCCNARVAPIFDTQVAMALTGAEPQISYRTLIEEMQDVKLDKGSQFSDWLKRPLSARQQEYALNDVSYLIEAYPKVLRRLEELKRVAWFAEDMIYYTDESFYKEIPDDQRYRNVKGAGKLKQRNLALLKLLAAWREAEGRRRNLRPRMILKDDLILNICYKMPSDNQTLYDCRLPGVIVKNYGKIIIECVNQALSLAEEELPESLAGDIPTDSFRKDFTKMARVIDEEAEKINLSSQVLLTRKKARAILYRSQEEKNVQLDKLTGWRSQILSEPLTSIITKLI